MADVPVIPEALKRITQQPRVRDFLAAALMEGRVSHAYLFLGAPGAGMLAAAEALAQCLVCPTGGDAVCDECIRVRHHTHPDVHHLRPEGVSGYLVDQIRDLVEDVNLAPVRASNKVYILDGADRLHGRSANALLKTIEEPPQGVVFILIARSVDAVLPTIASRCQLVPFRVIPPDVAQSYVEREAGVDADDARIALSVTGTPERAVEFLSSPGRRNVRRAMVQTLCELADDDTWDVLVAARDLYNAIQEAAGLLRGSKKLKRDDVVRDEVRRRTDGQEDYYTPRTLKQLEDTVRRELTARERSGIMEALAAAESLLRDVLVCCEGTADVVINVDRRDAVERIGAQVSTAGVLQALEACRTAEDDVAHNVTPQLALEVMLISIKEALACPPLYR